MDAPPISVAQRCLDGAYDGTLSFPEIIGDLSAAGFEGYWVDYRTHQQTYYREAGDAIALAATPVPARISPAFDPAQVEAAVRWAQQNDPGYSYRRFCERVMAAGCAGYIVSFPGRRVVYLGRTAETHVEHFPR